MDDLSGHLPPPVLPEPPSGDAQDQSRRTVAGPARPLDARTLRTVFLDLLARPPFDAELEHWHQKGFAALLDHLLGSPDFWTQWWEDQLYYFLLIDRFRPETDSARQIPTLLSNARLSPRDALHRLALTSSFDLRNPGSDTFVTVVMEQICGLTVQRNTRELDMGKKAYDGGRGRFLGVTAESQSDVIRICVNHKKSAQHLLTREYQRLIKRPPDPTQLAAWARRQHRDPYAFVPILREWFLSDAYLDRLAHPVPKSNRLFIRGLFVDLAGRLPRKAEMEPMRYALDGLSDARPLRSVIVRLLLDSGRGDLPAKDSIPDPTQWVAGRFQRFLGRDPTPEELETFVGVFHQPECQPATIVYALLSSREYHRY